MVLLIDTNVILDVLLKREPFLEKSYNVHSMCGDKTRIEAYVAAHSVTNIYYSIRKHFTDDKRRDTILELFDFYDVVSIDQQKIITALQNREFKDFEDCLQVECAKSIKADYIITRDTKDFASSEITFLTPEEFCNKFEENNVENAGE